MTGTSSALTADHYSRSNRYFLALNWVHLPLSLLTANLAETSLMFAAAMSLAILAGPSLLFWRDRRALETSIANAMALVCFSALLIHCSGGMTEMHFHIFSAIGLMITLAQPLAVVAALGVVVVHHVGFFFFLPASLINYQASFGILVIHALFALAIGIPAIFISKKFKVYIVGVKDLIGQIQTISSHVEKVSSSLLATSSQLTASATEEAAAVKEITGALELLKTNVNRNSENAQNTARSSEDSRDKAVTGQQVVERVVSSLGEIKDNSAQVVEAVNNSNERITDILRVIQEIGNKTRVINEIVFQTKLLSFNASVEAARAGEHGKGFAVVAQEIGNLAQMSGTSAKEISDLLGTSLTSVESIIAETKASVASIVENGKNKVETGVAVAEQCKQVLTDINQNISASSQVISEMAVANKEQTMGVNDIARAMDEVESATLQNSSMAETASKLAKDLSEEAGRLKTSVRQLALSVDHPEEPEAPQLLKRSA